MRRAYSFLILATIMPVLTGCFSICDKRMSGPAHPRGVVEVRRTRWQPAWIIHYLPKTTEFNLDVCVANTRNWLRVDFWFYVIPFPEWSERNYYHNNHLTIEMGIDPKGANVVFDPSRIFYTATNQVRVAPTRAWQGVQKTDEVGIICQNYDSGHPLQLRATEVTSPTWFNLEFDVDDSPDQRFDLILDGLTIDGRTNSLGRLRFKPVSILRPEFMLPY